MSTLTDIRDDYIRRFRPRARAEAEHFARGPAEQRVRIAALARRADGRKHKHQWRISPALLEKFAERLIGRLDEIKRASSFAILLAIVDAAKLKGVSELAVYDTAVRIGAGQGLNPQKSIFMLARARGLPASAGTCAERASRRAKSRWT